MKSQSREHHAALALHLLARTLGGHRDSRRRPTGIARGCTRHRTPLQQAAGVRCGVAAAGAEHEMLISRR